MLIVRVRNTELLLWGEKSLYILRTNQQNNCPGFWHCYKLKTHTSVALLELPSEASLHFHPVALVLSEDVTPAFFNCFFVCARWLEKPNLTCQCESEEAFVYA